MIVLWRWLRLCLSYCLFAIVMLLVINKNDSVYLFYQAKGQLQILINTESIEHFAKRNKNDERIIKKIKLIEQIKMFSVDSLNYKPTNNFTRIYDQHNSPILWVLTVSQPYELKAYEWKFPVVGSVSYKGYFKKELALKSFNHFKSLGFDVDIRSVSAWSTLGWLNDPVLSNSLQKNKGEICNLFFHELFHATYYAQNSVNFNENIASFIAHKATVQFLNNDIVALKKYLDDQKDKTIYRNYMLRQSLRIKKLYQGINNNPNKYIIKLKAIDKIADSIRFLPGIDTLKLTSRKKIILSAKNAYFIDFEQYDSLQDSLEDVFNKIYNGELKNMVRDLRYKAGNY